MQFLFPSDYFSVKKPDEGFINQMSCFRSAEFETSVISFENFGNVGVWDHSTTCNGSTDCLSRLDAVSH